MTLQKALLLLAWACLSLPTLIAATEPAHIHEARQGPINTQPVSLGPGPVSIQPSSISATTTMSSKPSSEPSSSSSSTDSPLPSSASPNTPSHSSSPSGTLSSPSSSGSSAYPQPSSSPSSLNFIVRNMTTCTSGLISWTYNGKEAPLFLSITNIGVPQNDASLRIGARQSTVDSTIQRQLVDTNTSAPSWTWPSVNVTQGWYEIQGLVLSTPTASWNSAPFFVANGTDVTCLIGTSPQASSTASPGTSASPSSAFKSNTGSIVGGIIGGVLGIALAIIAGVCLWSWRRRRSFVERSGSRDRNWGSLKSTSSTIRSEGSGAHLNSDRFHADSESTGAIFQDAGVGKASVTTTPGGSDEDVLVVSGEKLVSPASSSGMSPFDALNTPAYYDRRTSTYSVRTPTTAASESFRSRVSSTLASGQNLEQQAQRIRSSMETSIRRRSERLSMPTLPSPALARFPHSPTRTQPREDYPLTPVSPTPVNRSISTGAVSMTARRTSRKPVPHYDSSILLEDKNTDSVSTLTAGADSSQSHGAGAGTGTHGTPSDLTRKASFLDGRPVHYLIPDMPPPPQD